MIAVAMRELTKDVLVRSVAGMRLIALMTLYNGGEFGRLRAYVADNFHADVLADEPPGVWLAMFRLWRKTQGRLRVQQALATDKHHVAVLVRAERDERLFLADMQVEDDYPHRVRFFALQAIE